MTDKTSLLTNTLHHQVIADAKDAIGKLENMLSNVDDGRTIHGGVIVKPFSHSLIKLDTQLILASSQKSLNAEIASWSAFLNEIMVTVMDVRVDLY